MKKLGIFVGCFLLLISGFRSEVNAITCDPACTGNQHCIQDGPNKGTCQSEGAGLTKPSCSINFSGGSEVGNKIFVHVNTWDNGEVYIQAQPKLSGTCAQFAGFCPINANVCTKTNNAVCSNVCSTLYFRPKYPGACNVSVTVSNNAGSSTCGATLSVQGEAPSSTPTRTPSVSPSPIPPVVSPPPSGSNGKAFLQVSGGNVTALNGITNANLPSGKTFVLESGENAKDAGVAAGQSLSLPSGAKLSNPGWKLVPYSSLESVPSYATLLTNVLRNGGFSKVSDIGCLPSGKASSLNGLVRFYCYTNTVSLNSLLSEAIANTDKDDLVRVLVPYDGSGGNGTGVRELTSEFNFTNSTDSIQPILLFVDGQESGGLKIKKDLVTALANKRSAFLAVVNGGVQTTDTIQKLDGMFLMTDSFNDLLSDKKLVGNGSLLGGGADFNFNFSRTFSGQGQPAELWNFDGRYLALFRNFLARPKFFWQELPPQ